MTSKFRTKNNVITEPVDTVARCVKFRIPDEFCHVLDELYPKAFEVAREMLENRKLSSSKYWKSIPCVVAKSLITKYQRDRKCRAIHNLVIPICGDKGKIVKMVPGGVRVPALFKKAIIPAKFPWDVVGFVRQVEFFNREGVWYMSACVNTACAEPVKVTGVVGVDCNSVGNVAVMANIQTGKVFKLGIDPAGTKKCFRGRRGNLQKAGKSNLLKKIRRKQSRRMTYENHKASKTIVDYAASHCLAIVLENLSTVRAKGSKIKRYSEKNQWAYAQLALFIMYKAALRGVPVIFVDPAYTSQECCKCGKIHKPNGKKYLCSRCNHKEHRDANAAFNIGRRGAKVVSGTRSDILSVVSLGHIGGPYAGKERALCAS